MNKTCHSMVQYNLKRKTQRKLSAFLLFCKLCLFLSGSGGFEIKPDPTTACLKHPTTLLPHPLKRWECSCMLPCLAWGWRENSVVKSTDYSSGGSRFEFQHSHGSSQLPVTLVLGALTSHSEVCEN